MEEVTLLFIITTAGKIAVTTFCNNNINQFRTIPLPLPPLKPEINGMRCKHVTKFGVVEFMLQASCEKNADNSRGDGRNAWRRSIAKTH